MSYTIDLRDFEGISDNIYEAVIVTAKRARQIHSKDTEELRRKLGELENEEELDEENVDRDELVSHYDNKPKASISAIHEFLDKKLNVDVPNRED